LLNRDDGPPKNGSQDMTGPEKGSDPNIAVSRTAYSERLLAREPAQCQNSASKMMIGIGTPNNQSKIPRPISSSMIRNKKRCSAPEVPSASLSWRDSPAKRPRDPSLRSIDELPRQRYKAFDALRAREAELARIQRIGGVGGVEADFREGV
jgi:hypothetical protein